MFATKVFNLPELSILFRCIRLAVFKPGFLNLRLHLHFYFLDETAHLAATLQTPILGLFYFVFYFLLKINTAEKRHAKI